MQKVAAPTHPANWKPKPPAATASGAATTPTNFRRKRRHSEPHLTATKPYKNFVTHWKLETKKPAPAATRTSAPSSPTPEHSTPVATGNGANAPTGGNWSPSNSNDGKKSVFHPYTKKDGSHSPGTSSRVVAPPQGSVRWVRRTSLPQIYDSNVAAPFLSELARSAIMEEPDANPVINFPPSQNEYKFPPITLNFPPTSQDDILFRTRDDLAPFLGGGSGHGHGHGHAENSLPSLQALLQNVQDVSLSDDMEEQPYRGSAAREDKDPIQPPRSYVVRRRMSIDNLLE